MPDKRARRIADAIEPLRVKPGTTVRLGRDQEPRYKADFVHKQDGRDLLQTGVGRRHEEQQRKPQVGRSRASSAGQGTST